MKKAVIFDLDGTLLNSLQDLADSTNFVLEKYGKEPYPLVQYQTFVGNGIRKLVERAFGEDFEYIDEAFADFQTHYSENCTNASYLYETVYETLKELNKFNVPIAIHTNKAQDLTDKIVEHYLSDIDFVDVIGDRFDGLKKPDPHYSLEIMRKMKLENEDILFVGDSNVDMNTANNAKFKAIGVSWGFRDVKELKEHGADQIINRLDEIVEYFR